MSQRGKRQPNRTEDGPIATKRRKCRPSTAEEEMPAIGVDPSGSWTPRAIPGIYNRTTTEAPAELFRKDLISAMKLPDSEPLSTDEYWVITDQWKQEWERGVQVPVNPDSLPEPTVTVNHFASPEKMREFKLPKSKYIRITKDESFASDTHFLSSTPAKAEKACAYDLDDCDAAWLHILNGERAAMGLPPVTDDQLERVIEELEVRCWEKVQTIVKAEEGLGIEYDENVICDVCRSPDSEEGNEMVFCDCCNICVHQACYGITTIPSGSWLCRTCALGQRPECVLCPNKGGAMKCTRSGQKWAHVSCALWIPEVSIGCVERMEPITKISSIPQSRWALVCVLCRERVGACIQCSVKTCKTAYHVTCAFKHGLEMRAIIEDENADDGVKLRSYCQKHSVTSKKEKCGSQSEEEESKRRKRKDMTSEEKNQARAAKLHEVQAEFEKHVSVKDVTQTMDVDPEGVTFIYNYWKLKRRAGFNRPLLPPKSEDVDMLSHQQEQADIEKMKMFVQLRQDLERVRNLCYMVSRREKLSRSFFRMREQTFHKQAAVLSDASSPPLKPKETAAVIEANHGPSIYDRLYSQPGAQDHGKDFESVLARIAGVASPPPPSEAKPDLNGLVKCATDRKGDNPYKRLYLNGATRRRSSLYGSMSSESESDALRSPPAAAAKILGPLYTDSSSQDEAERARGKSAAGGGKVKAVLRKKSRKAAAASRTKAPDGAGSTSDDDAATARPAKGAWPSRSRSLRQMERELASATDDSDELLPIKSTKTEPQKIAAIYSDSETDGSRDNDDKYPPCLRTKAAMKEFSGQAKAAQKGGKAAAARPAKKPRDKQDDSMDDESTKDKENVKSKKDYVPSDMIVPQRQAAKKASESMRFSQGRSKDQVLGEQDVKPGSPPPAVAAVEDVKPRPKLRHKSGKDRPDALDADKDPGSGDEPADLLAYVPQRQAAKKAADNIKSGMSVAKPAPGDEPAKEPADAAKPAALAKPIKREEPVDKKPNKSASPGGKAKPPPKSRPAVSSSSSSSSSGDSTSSSDSDSDAKPTPPPAPPPPPPRTDRKEPQKEPAKKRAHGAVVGKPREDWPFLDKGDQSSRSSSSSSAGSASSDSDLFTRKKDTVGKVRPRPAADPVADRRPGGGSGGGGRFKKAPDKKLKTSEGRPELEFVPPIAHGVAKGGRGGRGGKPGDDPRPRAADGDRVRDAASRPRVVADARSGSDDGDRPRAARAPQQPRRRRPSAERRGGDGGDGKKDEHGRSRKPGDIRPRDAAAAGERPRGDSRPPPSAKGVRPREEKRDAAGARLEREIMREKVDSMSTFKRTAKPPSDRLYDRRASKNDKPPQRKSLPPSSPAKAARKEDVRAPRNDASPAAADSARKSDDDDAGRKESPVKSEPDAKGKSPKVFQPLKSATHRPSKERSAAAAPRPRGRYKDTSPNDRRCVPVAQVIAVKRDDSPDDAEDAKARHRDRSKAKAMPKCKKKELEQQTTDKPHKTDKTERPDRPEKTEKPDADGVIVHGRNSRSKSLLASPAAERPTSPPTITPPRIPSPPPVVPAQAAVVAEPFLPKLDLEHDFLAPEAETEPRKITSRTSSLSGPAYQPRSMFSPQQPKDSAAADLFDFENDILAVDETVNDDGFNMPGDSAELCRPLTFSFSSDFLFKEESKEDSERETLNLVEKLRLQYAQKTTGPTDAADTPPIAAAEEERQADAVEPPARPEVVELPDDDAVPIEHRPSNIKYAYPEPEGDVAKLPYPRDDFAPTDVHPASIPSVEKPDPSNSAPSDERWVPPSGPVPAYDAPPPAYELPPSVAPPPSPFTDHRARAKWADSEVLPVRRSSSSSGSSSSSSSHREDAEPAKRDDFPSFPHNPADLYQQMHAPYPPCADPYHPYSEAMPFSNPVALFPPATAPLPFPSPGAGMYPPLFGPGYHPQAPPPAKEEAPPPCAAAFTSCSHNMALISAMVNAQTMPHSPAPSAETPASPNCMAVAGANQTASINAVANRMSPPEATDQTSPFDVANDQSPMNAAVGLTPAFAATNHVGKESPSGKKPAEAGKKSPTKGTRTSARVTSQLKSPGKSPRQEAAAAAKSPARPREPKGRGKARGAARRGRGAQGRGRGNAALLYQDVDRGTIHSKLAGTVYDLEFDDDDAVESMRAMRERRRSTDVHEAASPRFASPRFGGEPAPHRAGNGVVAAAESPARDEDLMPPPSPAFVDAVVRPLLPGPVDMRTYGAYEPSPANNPAAYHNHVLSQFATAVAQQHVADFAEDFEKELHSQLAASKAEPPPPPPTAVVGPDEGVGKVSLSDSRNQLKVKIKGPFLDANYVAASSAAPPPAPPPADVVVAATPAFSASGVSSLRRMRKKELLRQYCSQDMNMADPSSVAAVPAPNPPVSRTIITIPKAVASMTTIPTREDYKAVVDANMEKKRRKEGAPRELRHLELALGLDPAASLTERRRSVGSTGSAASLQDAGGGGGSKKRGRPAKPGAECPVLKIKIGAVRSEAQIVEDKKRLKPPKKRLSNVATPSMEDMKRESMKYRRLVMAEFDTKKEAKRARREARAASGKPPKKRRHKDKSEAKDSGHEVRIVANTNSEESSSAPKLIIRFNKRASVAAAVDVAVAVDVAPPAAAGEDAGGGKEAATEAKAAATPEPKQQVPPNGGKTTGPSPLLKVRASKVTPIRLKLARCSEGYVMKTQSPGDGMAADTATATLTITDADQVHANNASPVLVSKGCEVR